MRKKRELLQEEIKTKKKGDHTAKGCGRRTRGKKSENCQKKEVRETTGNNRKKTGSGKTDDNRGLSGSKECHVRHRVRESVMNDDKKKLVERDERSQVTCCVRQRGWSETKSKVERWKNNWQWDTQAIKLSDSAETRNSCEGKLDNTQGKQVVKGETVK